jgi:hypothetical protein
LLWNYQQIKKALVLIVLSIGVDPCNPGHDS